jgi:uncharacterized RDD family membrane protein YckC
MTREEHLKFCEICKNQKYSMNQGIICRFTNKIADFEGTCNLFEEDSDLVSRLKRTKTKGAGATVSKERRFVNLILDTIVYSILYIIFLFVFLIVLKFISPSSSDKITEDSKILFTSLYLVVFWLYYFTMESWTGRTIAKYITKTKVVNEKGEKPSAKTIMLRTICRSIPFEYFSYLGEDNFGWHDSLSKTKVIEV